MTDQITSGAQCKFPTKYTNFADHDTEYTYAMADMGNTETEYNTHIQRPGINEH